MGNIFKTKEVLEKEIPEEPKAEKKLDEYQWTFAHIPSENQEIKTSNNRISIMTFNILADCHIHFLSSFIDPKFQDFSYRSEKVIKIISTLSPDIIMLQEVDNYTFFYKEKLINLGYEMHYKSKENLNNEGCALGFKSNLFELKSSNNISLNIGHEYENDYDFRRGNIAIHAKLQHKDSKKIVNVINTHFFWDPKCEHVKYLQMAVLLRYINKNMENNEIIFWGGDLNSKPENNVVQFVLNGSQPELEKMEGTKESKFEKMLEIYEKVSKIPKIEWDNAYQYYGLATGQKDIDFPNYTNFVPYFKGTIDHVFFNKNSLRPKKILKMPSEEEIKNKSLPNKRFPSDHLPVMAEFEIL